MDLKVQIVKVGLERTNCYVVTEKGGDTIVIDPGAEPDKIIETLKKIKKLNFKYILLTHGHFDHVGAVDDLKAKYPEIHVYISGNDVNLFEEVPEQGVFVGRILKPQHTEVDAIFGGQFLPFGDMEVEVIDTPGHTPGGVCYKIGEYLFTGDTLFYHTYGRVDLPHSNAKDMKESLKKILYLPETTHIYPGHGKQTSIAEEKKLSCFYFNI